MSALAMVIGAKQWELAAICLVLGVAEAVSKLPADSKAGLLQVLDGDEDGKKEG